MFAVSLLIGCAPAIAQSTESQRQAEERLETAIQEFLEQHRLPSLSVAVVAEGRTVLRRAYGFSDTASQTEATPNTLYPIGSIEKQFTAAALMLLAEQGKLTIDDPITEYLPRLFTDDQTITIAQMLHQVSGLQDFITLPDPSELPDARNESWSPVPDIEVGQGFQSHEIISVFDGQPLYFRPGERFSYSQPNYDLLCYVIAHLSGQTYYESIANLAAKAGLGSFHAEWVPRPSNEEKDVATGYIESDNGFEVAWEPNLGSAWTTAEDLAKWSLSLDTGRVVSADSYRQMTSPARLNDGRTWPYGYGLELQTFEGTQKHVHTGRTVGYYAVVARYPDNDISIALMTNLGGASDIAFVLEPKIARALIGVDRAERLDIPLTPEDQARFIGTYDAGAFLFEVVANGTRLDLLMRFSGDPSGDVYDRTTLYYQGSGRFAAPGGPEWNDVAFSNNAGPADEVAVGQFAQAVRRDQTDSTHAL